MKNARPVRPQTKPAPVRLKGWKRWAFPLAALIILPTLIVVLLEIVLRVAGYGFPTEFLIRRKVAGATVLTDNQKFGWRFFPPAVARRPADILLPAEKPPGTYRIFVLGESAAMGDPDTAYGITRLLDVMLSASLPGKKFEVVNAAMTGISSHVIREIANDCAQYQPDFFVIYMGNNEAIGPYGPGTVFASFSEHLVLTRLSIAVRSLKITQLVESLVKKPEQPEGWGGLRVFMKSQFHPTDARLALLADHFESNLKAICEAGRGAGAKVVVSSVASNLKDCSPFASLNAPTLSPDQKSAWDARWAVANKLEFEGKFEEALKGYQEAEAMDGSHAELQYRKGSSLAALKRAKEAHESFSRARDFDALRFRTTPELNTRAKRVAESFPASEVAFADVVKAIEDESAGAGVGSAHFVDHVHFSFHGAYAAAREIFGAVTRFIPEAAGQVVLTEQECAERLAYSRWNQLRIAEYMLKRYELPPFSDKSDAAARMREFRAALARAKEGGDPAYEAVAVYHKALETRPVDPDLLKRLAEIHVEIGPSSEELKYRQKLLELFPYDDDRKAYLAEAYSRSPNFAEGEKLAREVLQNDPEQVIAHLGLARSLKNKGALHDAAAGYQQVLRRRPDMSVAQDELSEVMNRLQNGESFPNFTAVAASPDEAKKYLETGEGLLLKGRVEDAIRELQMAIRLDSSSVEAHTVLARALLQQGKLEPAAAACREALRLRPDYVPALNELGAVLSDLNQYAEAEKHLRDALRLAPDNDDVQFNLGLNLMREKRLPEALAFFEPYAARHPDEANVHLQMGMLYEGTANWEKAVKSYRETLRLEPENDQYRVCLAWILATSPQDTVRNGAEALQLAEAACRTTKQVYTIDTLAAALAETGRYPEAIKAAEEALLLAKASNDPQTEEINGRVALYKSNKPYRYELPATDAAASSKQ